MKQSNPKYELMHCAWHFKAVILRSDSWSKREHGRLGQSVEAHVGIEIKQVDLSG